MMGKSLLSAAFAACALLAATTPAFSADSYDGWKLVWSDEFNVDGAPNPEFWNFEKGFVRNKEFQWYQEPNAYCKNGFLIIEGRKERVKNPNYKKGSKWWGASSEFAEYTSSSITTKGKKEFLYGRVEVRARVPFGKGAWPAIWSVGAKSDDGISWPSCGEIDIMEYYRINGVPTILANACWGGKDKKGSPTWDSQKIPLEHFQRLDSDWLANFHVWRMDWDENFIDIYLDGELLNRIELEKTVNGAVGKFVNPFKRPHYFLLNLAIGGVAGGVCDPDAFPMKYEIDYIRVYQKK